MPRTRRKCVLDSQSGLYNQRGVHSVSAGKEEREIASRYRNKADALAEYGFHRVAEVLRNLADSYEHDAEREAERNIFE